MEPKDVLMEYLLRRQEEILKNTTKRKESLQKWMES